MAGSDPHEQHGDATLSIAEQKADGSWVFQSWTICACNLPALRARLGSPAHQSIGTAAAVAEVGATVLAQPGSVQIH